MQVSLNKKTNHFKSAEMQINENSTFAIASRAAQLRL
jgi:hypothetical protein